MKLNLFPIVFGLWNLNRSQEDDTRLCKELTDIHNKHQIGSEIWERTPHNIFDGSNEECNLLYKQSIPLLSEMLSGKQEFLPFKGIEVFRSKGVEIMPHTDSAEPCHLQAVYFPQGDEIDININLMTQMNKYCENGFAICSPNWHVPTVKQPTPWEKADKYWFKPHRGLLIVFDSRAVHFQKPYMGEGEFIQVIYHLNIKY